MSTVCSKVSIQTCLSKAFSLFSNRTHSSFSSSNLKCNNNNSFLIKWTNLTIWWEISINLPQEWVKVALLPVSNSSNQWTWWEETLDNKDNFLNKILCKIKTILASLIKSRDSRARIVRMLTNLQVKILSCQFRAHSPIVLVNFLLSSNKTTLKHLHFGDYLHKFHKNFMICFYL